VNNFQIYSLKNFTLTFATVDVMLSSCLVVNFSVSDVLPLENEIFRRETSSTLDRSADPLKLWTQFLRSSRACFCRRHDSSMLS